MAASNKIFEDIKINVRLKIAGAWISLLFLYAYGDIFGFYRSGYIENIQKGKVFVFDINQGFLFGISAYIAIPSVLVFLTLVLKPKINRLVNIVAGIFYAVTPLFSAIGDQYVYYYFLSILEAILAAAVVRYAWKWPSAEH